VVYSQDLRDKMPGEYSVTWDGKNQQGGKAGSGVYFYKIVAQGREHETWSASRKMILLR
jgi:flagellar hook assembly protein FlgD